MRPWITNTHINRVIHDIRYITVKRKKNIGCYSVTWLYDS